MFETSNPAFQGKGNQQLEGEEQEKVPDVQLADFSQGKRRPAPKAILFAQDARSFAT